MYPDEKATYTSTYPTPTSSVPVKESPTTRELMLLSKQIAEITMMSEELVRRLASVLSPAPEVGKDGGVPQEPLSEVPAEIRRNRESLGHPTYNLKSILSRLEI